jgi:pilus assembly protein Flp/PilA
MSAMLSLMRRFADDESGATAIEYSLICSLIFMAVVSIMQSVAGKTIDMYAIIEGAM